MYYNIHRPRNNGWIANDYAHRELNGIILAPKEATLKMIIGTMIQDAYIYTDDLHFLLILLYPWLIRFCLL